jgi:Zn-dependent protease with chaperone function
MIEDCDMTRGRRCGARRCLLLLALCALLPAAMAYARPQAAPASSQSQASRASRAEKKPPEGYSLSPELRQKAVAYSHTQYALYFLGVAWSFALYFFLWRKKVGVIFREWAGRVSSGHFIQSLIFVPLFLGVVSLAEFPLDYYSGFTVEHRFGLSTETFAAWLGDWGKSFAIWVVFMVFLIWILYLIIRRSPRRWWFYFWLVTLPVALGVIFLQPLIIDPLFFKFTPLEKSQPELTSRIEQMFDRAGLHIPRSHIYEMNASSKTKTVNAYVTGIGASKRLVIWDTTLKKLTPDETLLVVGHETGHYVLEHIPKMFCLIELVALGLIFAGFVAVERLVGRFGASTKLEGVGDLASLPLLFLVLTVVTFLASPAVCAISRHYEHQADQYSLEVSYGIVPDPNGVEARSFQILGEEDLADPDPSAFIKFWLYTHPPLDERIRFAMSYKPWAEGKPLEFVRSRQ